MTTNVLFIAKKILFWHVKRKLNVEIKHLTILQLFEQLQLSWEQWHHHLGLDWPRFVGWQRSVEFVEFGPWQDLWIRWSRHATFEVKLSCLAVPFRLAEIDCFPGSPNLSHDHKFLMRSGNLPILDETTLGNPTRHTGCGRSGDTQSTLDSTTVYCDYNVAYCWVYLENPKVKVTKLL